MPAAEDPQGILRSCKAGGAADAGCIGKLPNAAGAEKPQGGDPSGVLKRSLRLGIEAGAEERFTKVVTERDLLLTAEITGDHDPLHVDEAYAARTAYGQRIAHGALVLGLLSSTASRIAHRAIAAGAEGVPVSLGYDRVRFLAPVFVGDALTAHYRVESVDPARGRSEAACEVVKADGTRCLVARHILKWVTESR